LKEFFFFFFFRDAWFEKDSTKLAAKSTYSSSAANYVVSQSNKKFASTNSNSYSSYGYSSYNSNENGPPTEPGAVGLRNLGNTCVNKQY
jgi:hypothetical protein